jgi:hypothetical protein
MMLSGGGKTMQKSSYQHSLNRSDIKGPQTQQPVKINLQNSGESELDIDFGYQSEEESIFQSFSQEVERTLPKIKKTFSLREDTKMGKAQVKDMLKRVTSDKVYEFMIRFKIEMDGEDSSSIYSASGTTPMAMIDEREKKKFLKVHPSLLMVYSKRSRQAINQTSLTRR